MAFSRNGAANLILRVPTTLFPVALGISGLGSLFLITGRHWHNSTLQQIGTSVLFLAAIVLTLEALFYSLKIIRNQSGVLDDWKTATRANLIAPGFMASQVIGGMLAADYPVASWLWIGGSAGHFILLVSFIGRWLTHEYNPQDLNPTWFLPAAGIMTAPMTWPGVGPAIIPFMLFGIGCILWLMLLPIVFRRLTFEPSVAPDLRPTLFIVAAPFGLFAGAVLTLFPETWSALALFALSGGTFFALVLMTQFQFLMRAGVTLSWWASTFPVATLSAGYLRLPAQPESTLITNTIGIGLLVLACITTSIAIMATIRAVFRTCRNTIASTELEIKAMHGVPVTPKPAS